MSAVAGGPGSVPPGEQVLWRGAPDSKRMTRRWLSAYLRGAVGQLVGLALFLFIARAALTNLGNAVYPIAGFLFIFWAVPAVLQYVRVRGDARRVSYLLTDQRLLIEGRGGRRDLRLVNLPDLHLEAVGDGFGSIFFTQPTGLAAPEQYVRRLARWVPQLDDSTELLACIPEAERVMGLLSRAQADALAAAGGSSSSLVSARRAPVPTEGPVAIQPFMRQLGIVPFWFGGAFLVFGVGILVVVAIVGPWALAVVGAPFALFGAAAVRARYLLVREQRHLRSAGVRTSGRVVDLAGTGTQVNDVEQWIVRYAFEVNGTEHRGQSAQVPWSSVARYAPGDEVEVVYDPADPTRSSMPELAGG